MYGGMVMSAGENGSFIRAGGGFNNTVSIKNNGVERNLKIGLIDSDYQNN